MSQKLQSAVSSPAAESALQKGFQYFQRYLEQHQINIDHYYEDDATLLHNLVMFDSKDKVKTLIAMGANILLTFKSEPYQNALHLAARKRQDGHLTLMLTSLKQKSLLQEGLNSTDVANNTPLHLACKLGNEKCIQVLLHFGANGTLKNAEGKTPYDLLLDKDAQLAAKFNSRLSQPQVPKKPAGMTMFSAPQPRQKQPSPPTDGSLNSGSGSSQSTSPAQSSSEEHEATQVLPQHHWDTLLIKSIEAGNKDAVIKAIQGGANANCTYADGTGSALTLAATCSLDDISCLLLENGADPTVKISLGPNAIHMFASKGLNKALVMALESRQFTVDIDCECNLGSSDRRYTAFQCAALFKQLDSMKILVAHGCNTSESVIQSVQNIDSPVIKNYLSSLASSSTNSSVSSSPARFNYSGTKDDDETEKQGKKCVVM